MVYAALRTYALQQIKVSSTKLIVDMIQKFAANPNVIAIRPPPIVPTASAPKWKVIAVANTRPTMDSGASD